MSLVYQSAVSYCNKSDILSWSCSPCQFLPVPEYRAVFEVPAKAIQSHLTYNSKQGMVISSRGTEPTDIMNWIVDFNITKVAIYPGCSGCLVHAGFYYAFLDIADSLYNVLDSKGGRSIPSINTTGHSLGGAITTILSYELSLGGFALQSVMNFGAPRAGNKAFADSFASLSSLASESSSLPSLLEHEPFNDYMEQSLWSPFLISAVIENILDKAKTESRSLTEDETLVINECQKLLTEHVGGRPSPFRVLHEKYAKLDKQHEPLVKFKPKHSSSLRGKAAVGGVTTGFSHYRVVHWDDPVPHLPPEATGFAHVPTEIFYVEDQSTYTVCNSTNGEDGTCSDSRIFPFSVPDHRSYLKYNISTSC